MTDEQILKLLDKRQQSIRKTVVYPVIACTVFMIFAAVWTYLGKIRVNEIEIILLKEAKVDKKNFNEFLFAQNEINVLQEERQRILREDVDANSVISKEVGKRISELDKQIEIIKAKNKDRLDQYGMKTRDGGTVKRGLNWFIKDVPET